MGLLRKSLNWYARLSPAHGKVDPPYKHVVQIGDPILRRVCSPVSIDKINTEQVQKVIKRLNYVMNKYQSVGMSAPQIGVDMRIFVMRLTALQVATFSAEAAKLRGIKAIAPSVFINPELTVLNYQKVIYTEGCESFKGYAADVPRFKEVEISGYNEKGEPIKEVMKDWAARIVQHEIDHLDGKLYFDTMDKRTLHCTCWQEVNLAQGKVVVPFYPE